MKEKYIYNFNEGKKEMKELLGGKGANLAEMTKISLPVPPGFTLTTESCNRFLNEDETIWTSLKKEISTHLKELEHMTEKKFSDVGKPFTPIYSIWSSSFYAWYDGYDFKFRFK